MRKSKLMSLVLAVMMVCTLLAGCGSAPASSTPAPDASGSEPASSEAPAVDVPQDNDEFVELNFYMMNSPVPEQDRIMEKANAIIKDAINAKLNFVMVDGGTYAEKINLMINSGEEFDLCFMGNWGGINYFDNAAKEAFVDMTNLFPEYAPQTYARIPEALWDGVKVGGKIYASVNYQQWGVAQRKGYAIRMDKSEDVGFDWKQAKDKSAVEAMKLLGGFFEKAVPADPGMIGWETSSNYSFFLNDPLYWDMEPVGDMTQPGWIRYEDPNTVVNQFETPEFKEYCDIMRDWYQKGYVRKDGATLADVNPDRTGKRILAQWSYAWPDYIDFPPTGVSELTIKGFADAKYVPDGMSMTQAGEAPAGIVTSTRTVIPAAAAPTACVAISETSKNPVRAMKLIELLNTNDELFNLIQWGEEGVDFYYDDNGDFKQNEGKYNFNWNEWQIGQSYHPDFVRSNIARNQKGEDSKAKMKVVFEADLNATPSPVTGFEFNPDPVKTEIANCAAVITEVVPVLSNGAADPAEALPKFLERLKAAGIDTIIAEKQAQIDAWKAANA